MQLSPGERSILATFQFTHKAREAARALEDAGFTTLQIDRIGAYGYEPEPDQKRPGQGAVVQSSQILYGSEKVGGGASGPLLAAMPEASGMAGGESTIEGVLLTAVVPAARSDEAVAIIRRHGGTP